MKVFTCAIIGALVLGLGGAMVGSGESYYIKKSQRATAERTNIPTAGIVGAVLGLIIGGAIGKKLEDEEEQKAQVTKAAEIETAKEQAELERLNSIFLKLGIIDYLTDISKEGRYWVGLTKWVDRRINKLYTLKTETSESGELKTFLNGQSIFAHMEKRADKVFVTSAHEQSRGIVFKRLTDKYQENNQITLDEMFELPAEQT